MKTLKLLLLFLASIFTATSIPSAAASPEHPSKSLGVLGGYNTRNKSGEAGIFFQYRIKPHIRIAPDVTYITRRKGIDALDININVHFPLLDGGKHVNVYPLGGLSYTSWNIHNDYADVDDTTERSNKFGLNVGAGFEACLTPTLKLRLEGKWTAARHACTADFSIGIGYMF